MRVEDESRVWLQPLDLRPGGSGVRMIEVDEVVPLGFQQLPQHRGKPAVPAVPGGQPGNHSRRLVQQRRDRGRPREQMNASLEQSREHAALSFSCRRATTVSLNALSSARRTLKARRAPPVSATSGTAGNK